MDEVVRDAAVGALKPIYNYITDLPALEDTVTPFLPGNSVRKTIGNVTTFDAGRGCPFQCSFCTIINVQGRKSRRRGPDDVERILRKNYEHGIDRFFITDDNFARNKDWEPILDRIIKLREQDGMDVRFLIQVDTMCHKIPNFVAKETRAGATRIFIGLENINPDNLIAAKKRQNKITEYRAMLQKWRAHGALTFAGYILGFPADTKESILRDVEIIKRELPLDILEFFFLTPLPGSEDHKNLLKKGVWMDPDINKYDLDHRVSHHAKMSDAEWEEAYRAAWDAYYTPEHIRTILKRAAQIPNGRPKPIASTIMWFKLMIEQEGLHPLEGGAFRLKSRRDRRDGLPLESRFVFYPRYAAEIAVKFVKYLSFFLGTRRILKEVLEAPDRWTYSDLAIAPPRDDEFEALELYHATTGGEAALARKKLGDSIRTSVPAAAG